MTSRQLRDRSILTPPTKRSVLPTLIIGHGYVGGEVAARLAGQVDPVFATTRRLNNPANHPGLKSSVEMICLDITDSRTFKNLRILPPIDRLLFSVGYSRASDYDRDQIHVAGLARVLDHFRDQRVLPHVVSLSSTGVYHQTDGRWVDENSPTRPTRPGGQSHLRSESLLRRCWPADKQTVLRLAGIYGPGRWPNRDAIAAGRPIAADPDSYLNLIHRDDIVTAVVAALGAGHPGLYCVADDHPVRRRDYYDAIARSVGCASARFDRNADNPAAKSRGDSNKRIWNRKVKRDLVPTWQHPSSIDGIEDSTRMTV